MSRRLNRGQIAGITISVLVVIAVIVIAVVLSGAAAKKSENIIIAAQQQKDGTIKISTSTDTGSTWIDVKHPFMVSRSTQTTLIPLQRQVMVNIGRPLLVLRPFSW